MEIGGVEDRPQGCIFIGYGCAFVGLADHGDDIVVGSPFPALLARRSWNRNCIPEGGVDWVELTEVGAPLHLGMGAALIRAPEV